MERSTIGVPFEVSLHFQNTTLLTTGQYIAQPEVCVTRGVRCAPMQRRNTRGKMCTQNQGSWSVPQLNGRDIALVSGHFHCHAPTCLQFDLFDNETGALICREVPIYGGRSNGLLEKSLMKRYIAIPPCIFGDKEDGLLPPSLFLMGSMLLNMQIVHTDTMVKWHGCRCSLPQWLKKCMVYIFIST